MVAEQSQNYSGPPSPSSGKAPPLPWFLGRCPSRSLNFQRSYPTVWVLGWAGQAWVSGGSKGQVASHQAVAGTWLESARNPQILRPLPGTVQDQQHRFLLGERSEFRSASKFVHRHTHKTPSLRLRQVSVTRRCPPCFRVFFPANPVSLTKATQGAPKTGETVLHPRGKEGAPDGGVRNC